MSAPLYFTDAEGTRWRVYDIVFGTRAGGPGRRKGFDPPGPARCQYRLFKAKDGTERLYTWRPGEERSRDEASLAVQLRSASYGAREGFRPEEHRAR